MKTVELGFESGVPGFLPLPLQPVFQVISSWIAAGRGGRRSERGEMLGSSHFCGNQNGAEQVLNARIGNLFIVKFRVERKLLIRAILESGPVGSFEF
jgi:hypothetical protein